MGAAWTNLAREIDHSMGSLRAEIRSFEVHAQIDGRASEAGVAGSTFLRSWQNSDGSWAQGAMLNTNLALQALGLWSSSHTVWATNSSHAGGLDIAWEWLEREQQGPVWENIWNTAGIVRWAHLFGLHNRPSVERAIEWLQEQHSTAWGIQLSLPLQHVSQALITFDLLGLGADRDAACDALVEALATKPSLSAYTAGQALEALVCAGVSTESGVGLSLVEQVTKTLLTDHVSISNFLDVCSAFKGLGIARGGLGSEDEALQRTLGNFFSNARLRTDGSWYRDVTFTSYALIALTEVRSTRRIDAYPSQIYHPLERSRREIIGVVRREVRESHIVAGSAFGAGALGVALVVILVVQLCGKLEFPAESNLGWFIAPVILGACAGSARFAWARVSDRRKGARRLQ